MADKNVQRFEVERSSNGTTLTQIGIVNNDGKQQFAFTDAMPLAGTNYYRVKMVELDNGASYSTVRTVKFDASVWIVKLYPVPAVSFINIDLDNDKEEKAVITLHSTTGQQVLTQNQVLQKGFNHIVLSNLAGLAEGSYFITLQAADKVYRNKFIKGKY